MSRRAVPLPVADPAATLNRPDELVFLALGGVGEIGMNLGLYGYGGQWLMVDLGITFGDDTTPGLEILMADPAFIVDRRRSLAALVLTHAHEDHIGAVPHLWPRLRCPIYATPFTASVLRMKLAEAGLLSQVTLHEIPLGGRVTIGPFDVALIGMTHSIPEPNALVIRTGAGTVLHTGDWKFDPDPMIGRKADLPALAALGDAGIDAVICDSTNALKPGVAGSEADVRRSLIDLVGRYRKRVAIACFASNVARLQSAAIAAEANGRSCVLVGRSLWRMEQAARENGYLDGIRAFIREDEAMELPRDQVLLICTGSQGEPRSALTRIAAEEHPNVSLDPGDVAVFSSRVIPGNERSIGRLQNQLTRRGIEIVTDDEAFVHVSGHPARDELTQLYGLVRPRLSLPVHGEARHLIAHAKLAQECGITETIVAENGDMVRVAPGPAAIVDRVDTGRLGLDGKTLVPLEDGAFRTRLRMNFSGAAVATIVLDRHCRLAARPLVTVHGLLGENDSVDNVETAVERAVNDLSPALRGDDDSVRDAARMAVRRSLSSSHGKKPVTDIHVVRI